MWNTPLRTTTPVRAIPSTLSTRSSPSIPPPGQLYDPTLRAVLRYRLIYNIFLYSALLSWVHAVGWSIWHKGGGLLLGNNWVSGDPISTHDASQCASYLGFHRAPSRCRKEGVPHKCVSFVITSINVFRLCFSKVPALVPHHLQV